MWASSRPLRGRKRETGSETARPERRAVRGRGVGSAGSPRPEENWPRRRGPDSALRRAAGEGPGAELSPLPRRRGPAAGGLLFYLRSQGSSYYLYLSFAVQALLSPASSGRGEREVGGGSQSCAAPAGPVRGARGRAAWGSPGTADPDASHRSGAGSYLGCETRGSFTSSVRTSACTSAAAPSPRGAPGGLTSRLARLNTQLVHLRGAQMKGTAC